MSGLMLKIMYAEVAIQVWSEKSCFEYFGRKLSTKVSMLKPFQQDWRFHLDICQAGSSIDAFVEIFQIFGIAVLLQNIFGKLCVHYVWFEYRIISPETTLHYFQKQPSIAILMKGCSENVPQIYRRTNMLQCCSAALLKSYFGLGVLLQYCCIF